MRLDVRAAGILKSLARRVLARPGRVRVPPLPSDALSEESGHSRELPFAAEAGQADAWLEALEAGHLNPPRDVHDPAAWDAYWGHHLRVGLMQQGFADMMSSDEELPGLLARRDARSILCAGNGLSGEALSLALLGFNVTALDISTVPAEVLARSLRLPEHPVHGIPGFSVDDSNVVSFADLGPIDPERCPPIHRTADYLPRGGGSLSFATGDLVNPDVCPGPFDAVIERRTVQLFPPQERVPALQRLVARLAHRGLFVSHQHAGGWKPGQPLQHYAGEWLGSEGFVVQSGPDRKLADSASRLASLRLSTG